MTRLFVGGLTELISRGELEREFSNYGHIDECYITRNNPSIGFVVFRNYRDAEWAVKQMNGRYIHGNRLRVEVARNSSGGGRNSGSGGRSSTHGERSFNHGEKCYNCGVYGHNGRNCKVNKKTSSYGDTRSSSKDRDQDSRRSHDNSRHERVSESKDEAHKPLPGVEKLLETMKNDETNYPGRNTPLNSPNPKSNTAIIDTTYDENNSIDTGKTENLPKLANGVKENKLLSELNATLVTSGEKDDLESTINFSSSKSKESKTNDDKSSDDKKNENEITVAKDMNSNGDKENVMGKLRNVSPGENNSLDVNVNNDKDGNVGNAITEIPPDAAAVVKKDSSSVNKKDSSTDPPKESAAVPKKDSVDHPLKNSPAVKDKKKLSKIPPMPPGAVRINSAATTKDAGEANAIESWLFGQLGTKKTPEKGKKKEKYKIPPMPPGASRIVAAAISPKASNNTLKKSVTASTEDSVADAVLQEDSVEATLNDLDTVNLEDSSTRKDSTVVLSEGSSADYSADLDDSFLASKDSSTNPPKDSPALKDKKKVSEISPFPLGASPKVVPSVPLQQSSLDFPKDNAEVQSKDSTVASTDSSAYSPKNSPAINGKKKAMKVPPLPPGASCPIPAVPLQQTSVDFPKDTAEVQPKDSTVTPKDSSANSLENSPTIKGKKKAMKIPPLPPGASRPVPSVPLQQTSVDFPKDTAEVQPKDSTVAPKDSSANSPKNSPSIKGKKKAMKIPPLPPGASRPVPSKDADDSLQPSAIESWLFGQLGAQKTAKGKKEKLKIPPLPPGASPKVSTAVPPKDSSPLKGSPKVPPKNNATIPKNDSAALSPKEINVVPLKDTPAVSTKDYTAVPTKDKAVVPSKDKAVVPSKDKAAVPKKDKAAVPSKDKAAVPSKDKAAVPKKDMAAVPSKENAAVPPKDEAAITPKDEAAITPKDEAAITPKDEAAITLKDQAAVTPKDQAALTPKDKAALTPKDKAALTPKDKAALTPKNKAALTPKDKAALTPKDKAALTPKDKAALTPKDKAALTPKDKAAVTPKDKAVIRPKDSTAVTPKDSTVVTPKDSTAVTPKDSTAVPSKDPAAVFPKDSPALNKKKGGSKIPPLPPGASRVTPPKDAAEALSSNSMEIWLTGQVGTKKKTEKSKKQKYKIPPLPPGASPKVPSSMTPNVPTPAPLNNPPAVPPTDTAKVSHTKSTEPSLKLMLGQHETNNTIKNKNELKKASLPTSPVTSISFESTAISHLSEDSEPNTHTPAKDGNKTAPMGLIVSPLDVSILPSDEEDKMKFVHKDSGKEVSLLPIKIILDDCNMTSLNTPNNLDDPIMAPRRSGRKREIVISDDEGLKATKSGRKYQRVSYADLNDSFLYDEEKKAKKIDMKIKLFGDNKPGSPLNSLSSADKFSVPGSLNTDNEFETDDTNTLYELFPDIDMPDMNLLDHGEENNDNSSLSDVLKKNSDKSSDESPMKRKSTDKGEKENDVGSSDDTDPLETWLVSQIGNIKSKPIAPEPAIKKQKGTSKKNSKSPSPTLADLKEQKLRISSESGSPAQKISKSSEGQNKPAEISQIGSIQSNITDSLDSVKHETKKKTVKGKKNVKESPKTPTAAPNAPAPAAAVSVEPSPLSSMETWLGSQLGSVPTKKILNKIPPLPPGALPKSSAAVASKIPPLPPGALSKSPVTGSSKAPSAISPKVPVIVSPSMKLNRKIATDISNNNPLLRETKSPVKSITSSSSQDSQSKPKKKKTTRGTKSKKDAAEVSPLKNMGLWLTTQLGKSKSDQTLSENSSVAGSQPFIDKPPDMNNKAKTSHKTSTLPPDNPVQTDPVSPWLLTQIDQLEEKKKMVQNSSAINTSAPIPADIHRGVQEVPTYTDPIGRSSRSNRSGNRLSNSIPADSNVAKANETVNIAQKISPAKEKKKSKKKSGNKKEPTPIPMAFPIGQTGVPVVDWLTNQVTHLESKKKSGKKVADKIPPPPFSQKSDIVAQQKVPLTPVAQSKIEHTQVNNEIQVSPWLESRVNQLQAKKQMTLAQNMGTLPGSSKNLQHLQTSPPRRPRLLSDELRKVQDVLQSAEDHSAEHSGDHLNEDTSLLKKRTPKFLLKNVQQKIHGVNTDLNVTSAQKRREIVIQEIQEKINVHLSDLNLLIGLKDETEIVMSIGGTKEKISTEFKELACRLCLIKDPPTPEKQKSPVNVPVPTPQIQKSSDDSVENIQNIRVQNEQTNRVQNETIESNVHFSKETTKSKTTARKSSSKTKVSSKVKDHSKSTLTTNVNYNHAIDNSNTTIPPSYTEETEYTDFQTSILPTKPTKPVSNKTKKINEPSVDKTSTTSNDSAPINVPLKTQAQMRQSVLNFQKNERPKRAKRKRVDRYGLNTETNYNSDSSIEIVDSIASPWEETERRKRKTKRKNTPKVVNKVNNLLQQYEENHMNGEDEDDDDDFMPDEKDDDDDDEDITAEASRRRRLEDLRKVGNEISKESSLLAIKPPKKPRKARKSGRGRR